MTSATLKMFVPPPSKWLARPLPELMVEAVEPPIVMLPRNW